jgi:hypothetical protein
MAGSAKVVCGYASNLAHCQGEKDYIRHARQKEAVSSCISISLPPFPVDASSPPNCQLFPPDLVKVSRRAKYSLTALAGTISTQGAVIKYLVYLGVL